MVHEIFNLKLLSLELPDPDQHLYSQGDPLLAFACFPKLPIELRLAVWRFAFPAPCKVNIHYGQHDVREFIERGSKKIRCRTTQPLPIGLSVCKESRIETLKHYCVYLQQGFSLTGANYKPLCFNPSWDDLFINYSQILRRPGDYQNPSLSQHISSLKAYSPEHFANIQHLRLENVLPLSFYSQCWYSGGTDSGTNATDFDSDFNLSNEFILYFSTLRKVTLIAWANAKVRGSTVDRFIATLERNKDKFIGGSAPEVLIED